jgi:hypothetical protein
MKLIVLLLAVLAVMRLGSWAIGWILAKFAPSRPRLAAIVGNLLAFGVYTFLLVQELVAGEPLDWAAVWFGLVVFAICAGADFFWLPWRRAPKIMDVRATKARCGS